MAQQDGNAARSSEASARWEKLGAEIEVLYFVKGMTQRDIAAELGVSQASVSLYMKRSGIPTRRGNLGERNGRYVDGSQSRTYRAIIDKDKCKNCGSTSRLCVHHKNDDHYDNRLENLEILCTSCHLSHHKTLYWRAFRAGKQTPKSNGPVGWSRE
jgi:predicted transcriptional regulator